MTQQSLQLCLIPLITAFVGWYTNRLAIKFLFRPRLPINIGICTLHGLIPRRQDEIAEQIAETIDREFINSENIAEYLKKIDIEKHLDAFATRIVREKLIGRIKQIPLLGNFITDDSLGAIEKTIKCEILAEAGPLMEKIAADFADQLDIREKIRHQLSQYSAEEFEAVVSRIAKKEFRAIEWMGAALGFIAGIIQLAILWALGYLQYT